MISVRKQVDILMTLSLRITEPERSTHRCDSLTPAFHPSSTDKPSCISLPSSFIARSLTIPCNVPNTLPDRRTWKVPYNAHHNLAGQRSPCSNLDIEFVMPNVSLHLDIEFVIPNVFLHLDINIHMPNVVQFIWI